MTSAKQVRLSGFGGQGVVLAGTILGHAAIRDGKWVAGSSSYGAQARGGSARSDVVIADGPVVYPHVIEADILIALSQTAYDNYIRELAKDALVLFDDQMVSPKSLVEIKQVAIPSTSAALKELNQKQAANMVILGALASVSGLVSKESLKAAISDNVSSRFKESNLKALEVGYRLGERACSESKFGSCSQGAEK
jgi:2-oxoglutarate ferredoxin oxidoreductase subunit gamma